MKHGRDPKKWGDYKWDETEKFIDSLPAKPEEDPRGALQVAFRILYDMGCFLPCKDCRMHYPVARDKVLQMMTNNGIGLAERITRVKLHVFWWKVHDLVNRRLNKPLSQRLDWDQYAAKYRINESGTGRHIVDMRTSATSATRPANVQ